MHTRLEPELADFEVDQELDSLLELEQRHPRRRPRRRVRRFTCDEIERAAVERALRFPLPWPGLSSGVLRAQLERDVRDAVRLGRMAARTLRARPRTRGTRARFVRAFGVRADRVPSFRAPTASWRDYGDLVAHRLEQVVRILDGGRIHYFCWGDPRHCPGCQLPTGSYAACRPPSRPWRVCLGGDYWGSTAAERATILLHEALHIYYDTVRDSNPRVRNAYCYQRFVLEANSLAVPRWIENNCLHP
jgi:hypothetical protein